MKHSVTSFHKPGIRTLFWDELKYVILAGSVFSGMLQIHLKTVQVPAYNPVYSVYKPEDISVDLRSCRILPSRLKSKKCISKAYRCAQSNEPLNLSLGKNAKSMRESDDQTILQSPCLALCRPPSIALANKRLEVRFSSFLTQQHNISILCSKYTVFSKVKGNLKKQKLKSSITVNLLNI